MQKSKISIFNYEDDLLSDEVQDIIGSVPHWIVRCGVSIIFIFLLIAIAFSFIIKYPDVITAKVIITTEIPPVSIVSQNSGRIEKIFIKNGEVVEQAQVLAVISNTAKFEDVMQVESKLKFLSSNPLNNLNVSFSPHYSLGSIQESFNLFYIKLMELKNYTTLNLIHKRINSLEMQQNSFSKYISKLKSQERYQTSILELNIIKHRRDSILYSSKVISTAEFDRSKESLLNTRSSLESFKGSIINAIIDIDKLEQEIMNLHNQQKNEITQMTLSLNSYIEEVKNQIAEWRRTYLVTSPLRGKVSFNKYWTKNQFLTQGYPVFSVIPSNSSKIIGRVKLPISGSGKVRRFQKVNVKIENFPHIEYGIATARVENISLVPELDESGASYYSVEISFPHGLHSSYNINLPLNLNMEGTVEIITNELSLFDRAIQPLRSKLQY